MMLEGKKIISFAGRIHHWQKLSPLVEGLRQQGANIAYLCTDNATNNDPTTAYLFPAHEQFIHALNYLRQPSVQMVTEMTRSILSHIDQQVATPETDICNFVEPFWISYSIREACESMVSFANMLDTEKPSCVLILHENNFWTKSLAYLCKMKDIPCVCFQEGMLRLRDQKTLGKQSMASEYSRKLLVWSESAKQHYLESGINPDKVEVTGILHLDRWFRFLKNKEQFEQARQAHKLTLGFTNGKLVTFALPQINRYEGNPMHAIGKLSDWAADHFVQVAFRFHPFENEDIVEKLKGNLASHPTAKVITGGETNELLASSDLAISQHSTIAVEAMALGVPLVEMDLDNVGVLESLSDKGVAFAIRSGQLNKISDILSGKEKLDADVVESWKKDNTGPTDGLSVSRAIECINQVVA